LTRNDLRTHRMGRIPATAYEHRAALLTKGDPANSSRDRATIARLSLSSVSVKHAWNSLRPNAETALAVSQNDLQGSSRVVSLSAGKSEQAMQRRLTWRRPTAFPIPREPRDDRCSPRKKANHCLRILLSRGTMSTSPIEGQPSLVRNSSQRRRTLAEGLSVEQTPDQPRIVRVVRAFMTEPLV